MVVYWCLSRMLWYPLVWYTMQSVSWRKRELRSWTLWLLLKLQPRVNMCWTYTSLACLCCDHEWLVLFIASIFCSAVGCLSRLYGYDVLCFSLLKFISMFLCLCLWKKKFVAMSTSIPLGTYNNVILIDNVYTNLKNDCCYVLLGFISLRVLNEKSKEQLVSWFSGFRFYIINYIKLHPLNASFNNY